MQTEPAEGGEREHKSLTFGLVVLKTRDNDFLFLFPEMNSSVGFAVSICLNSNKKGKAMKE